jgi:hypothetical protein
MRVAWVGNSYTYFNDLPSMVTAMLSAALPDEVSSHGQVTPGGVGFAVHASDASVAQLLSHAWDAVVLQDHSGVPGNASAADLTASRTALIDTLAPMVPLPQRLILYGTWGHRAGSVYWWQRDAYPDFPTMQRLTSAGYLGYVDLVQPLRSVELAPVGDAFSRIYDEDLTAGRDPLDAASLFAQLYASDAFHPSAHGSYLAACVFTHVLLADRGQNAINASVAVLPAGWPGSPPGSGERLRATAQRAVDARSSPPPPPSLPPLPPLSPSPSLPPPAIPVPRLTPTPLTPPLHGSLPPMLPPSPPTAPLSHASATAQPIPPLYVGALAGGGAASIVLFAFAVCLTRRGRAAVPKASTSREARANI